MDEASLKALAEWHGRQFGHILLVGRDWAGTGMSERLQGDMALSLSRAVDILLGSDVESLWQDSDGVSMNGKLRGGIFFGVVGRRVHPKIQDGLSEWFDGTVPALPRDWTFHS